MRATDYVAIRAQTTLVKNNVWDDARHLELLSKIWVYKAADIKTVFEDMKELGDIWFNLILYLQADTLAASYARTDTKCYVVDRILPES